MLGEMKCIVLHLIHCLKLLSLWEGLGDCSQPTYQKPPLTNIIPQRGSENTSGPKYEKNDYQIAVSNLFLIRIKITATYNYIPINEIKFLNLQIPRLQI